MTENSNTLFSSFLFLALLIFVGYLMIVGRDILLPFVIAIVIWRVIVAMTDSVHRRSIGSIQPPYWLAVLVVFGALFWLIFNIVGIIVRESSIFVNQLPAYQTNLLALLDSLPLSLLQIIPAFSTGNLEEGLNTLILTAFDTLQTYMGTLASGLVGMVSQVSIVLIYVVFLLLEQNTFATKLTQMFPSERRRTDFANILKSIGNNITAYMGIKTWISFLLGVVVYIALWLFGLEHAIVWAILSFILNYIPFIGPIIAIIFPALTAILTSTNWGWIIAIIVVVSIIQFIFAYWVEPQMMGERLNVSPLVVLFSLAIFGAIWGLTGMFLSVPLTIILMIILGHFPQTRPVAVLLSEDGEVPG